MGEKAVRVRTSLSVKECAEIFRHAPQQLMSGAAKFQGFLAKVQGGVFTADFFTPQESGPFAALDDDRPAFSAGTWIRNGASPTNPTELHMYVWDRGSGREVLVIAGHGLVTGFTHAQRLVAQVADMIRRDDSGAQVDRLS